LISKCRKILLKKLKEGCADITAIMRRGNVGLGRKCLCNRVGGENKEAPLRFPLSGVGCTHKALVRLTKEFSFFS